LRIILIDVPKLLWPGEKKCQILFSWGVSHLMRTKFGFSLNPVKPRLVDKVYFENADALKCRCLIYRPESAFMKALSS
jgi:hypothetical protein